MVWVWQSSSCWQKKFTPALLTFGHRMMVHHVSLWFVNYKGLFCFTISISIKYKVSHIFMYLFWQENIKWLHMTLRFWKDTSLFTDKSRTPFHNGKYVPQLKQEHCIWVPMHNCKSSLFPFDSKQLLKVWSKYLNYWPRYYKISKWCKGYKKTRSFLGKQSS